MALQTERIRTVDQVRAFLDGSEPVDYLPQDRDDVYEFVRRTLVRVGYTRLSRPGKGAVRRYLAKMTGLSRAQVTRLIGQHRAWEVFGDRRFERLASLSSAHLYNLRRSKTYRAKRTVWRHTKPTATRIGVRDRPRPHGRPGFVRVDTVHQGDRDGEKGPYLINLVDEVTQFEHIGAVARISEAFLIPVLEALLVTLPFSVLGFHADNGSEYINRQVAE